MKAWVVETVTPSGDIAWLERPDPTPSKGTLVVRVRAAGLNFADYLMVRGQYQDKPPTPFTPGSEAAGEVVAVGDGSRFQIGDRVVTQCMRGGFAELVAAAESLTFKLPDGMAFAEAPAFIIAYPTAHIALRLRADVQPGETVLVHAGAGGVGSAAIQLAKAFGARVIATAGGAEKVQICRDLGADLALDYRDNSWFDQVKADAESRKRRGVDVIVDMVGGPAADQSVRLMDWGSRYCVVGFADAQQIPSFKINRFLLTQGSLLGVYWGVYAARNPAGAQEVFRDLFRLYNEGKIKPLVRDQFPLDRAPDALAALGSRGSVGKVVLTA